MSFSVVPVKSTTVSAQPPPVQVATTREPPPPSSSVTMAASSLQPAASSSQDFPDGKQNAIKNWNTNDVEKWLISKDLSNVKSKMKSCTGKQLVQMHCHYQRAPDFFLQSLKSDLKMDFFTVLTFTAALDELLL